MHLDAGQFIENVGDLFQWGPVKLDVLSGGKMAVVFVVGAGNMSQFSDLSGVKQAIRACNPQHWGMGLNVEAVH